MSTEYSNARAMRALTKASLQAIMRSPSAVVFGLAFPLIFILVFGFLGQGDGGGLKVSTAFAPGSDTVSRFAQVLKQVPSIRWKYFADSAARQKAFNDGDVVLLRVVPQPAGIAPQYKIMLDAASFNAASLQALENIIHQAAERADPATARSLESFATIDVHKTEVREMKTIDFILPGQLGFSLLAGSVFGTAFVFFNLRQTLVLKRFFATPVRREVIVISEGIARMIFQLLTAVIIIVIGHFAFGFTLVHGISTVLGMLALSALGILVFMGFGFLVSNLAKNESVIPAFSNMITLPQFLLAGTFFSIENFPKWLQPISHALPLAFFNHAMRQISFYGAGIGQIWTDLAALGGWGIVLYLIASRVFKWE